MPIDWSGFAIARGNKGDLKRDRLKTRAQRVNKEDAEKKAAKRRDLHHCCWPHETAEEKRLCRASHLEAAHYKAKGMGGDPQLKRSKRKFLITFCFETHRGATKSLHAGDRRVVPLEPDKCMDGPRAFEEKRGGRWVEVGREVHVGVLA